MWIIAHRGASGVAPENTMASFRRAVELGANFIETDLQLSRDGRLVALHDDFLDRTTNGHGAVSASTFEELRQLDAGSWFKPPRSRRSSSKGPAFAGERIPTLEEILAFAREKDIGLYLEMKTRGLTGAEQALVGALHAVDEMGRTVVLSFDAGVLKQVRQYEPLLVTGLLYQEALQDAVARAASVGARQLLPRADRITPALIEEAHRQDLKVVAWTVNTAPKMRQLAAAGVDGIITDHPDVLVKTLAKA